MKRLKINKKLIKGFAANAAIIFGTVLTASPVFAGDINSLTLFSGTKNLATVAVGGLTALISVIGSVVALKTGYAWHIADEDEKPRKKKAFFASIGITVVLACIPSLVPWILSFYTK